MIEEKDELDEWYDWLELIGDEDLDFFFTGESEEGNDDDDDDSRGFLLFEE